MTDLHEKIEELLKGLFALKEQQGPLVPTIKPQTTPGPSLTGLQSAISKLKSDTKVTSAMNTLRAVKPGMPAAPTAPKVPASQPVAGGMPPPSKKDPAKVAEQLKNPRPQKPQMEVLKTDVNGQWSLVNEK